ncbi:interleukin-13 receptor subunit alpha-1-like [Rhinoderma darwinii]|uniref:interleukin-13 receptor subunit alpha-1-like n=1 Tax=Rhinoderma darwinii TaxID=43563 RepID=UPI003F67654E
MIGETLYDMNTEKPGYPGGGSAPLSFEGVLRVTGFHLIFYYLPPPANITVRLGNMFQVFFKWEPSAANCTPIYNVVMSSSLDSKKQMQDTTKNPSLMLNIFDIDRQLDLNDNFSMEILANCNGTKSEAFKKRHMQLAPGNERTSVKNFICVWHYKEYINCTWLPGEDTPPNVHYRLLYWEKDTTNGTLPESAQLQDLLRTGTECQDYFPIYGLRLGCKFKYEYNIANAKELMFVVTDDSSSVKPFLYYTAANDIGKLRSPKIASLYWTINNNMYVNWTVSPFYYGLMFEVFVFSDRWNETYKVKLDSSMKINVPLDDDTWRVKVRVKFSEFIADSLYWSDWSEEWIVPGKDKKNRIYTVAHPNSSCCNCHCSQSACLPEKIEDLDFPSNSQPLKDVPK